MINWLDSQEFWKLDLEKKQQRRYLLSSPPELAQEKVNSILIQDLWQPVESDSFPSLATGMTQKYTPEQIEKYLKTLTELDVIVVGVQAINLWASIYAQTIMLELQQYIPFSIFYSYPLTNYKHFCYYYFILEKPCTYEPLSSKGQGHNPLFDNYFLFITIMSNEN